ncbi:ribonuclease Y [Hydrogenobacter hydrogenophilus]|uniref:Ribonuclease Y n=1 Tax=Hydrogenobacter hydrogenophilus TaxID=35835 RepID=A0A285P3H5_9AQUI|nr:ribonuclease Y [Hydrogenobacter hydrogenophilus]SNZ16292.1 ribonucrease Y [Hydrogenobacter hydrogenophilus]
MSAEVLLVLFIVVLLSGGVGFLVSKLLGKSQQKEMPQVDIQRVEMEARQIVQRAQAEAERILSIAKEEAEKYIRLSKEEAQSILARAKGEAEKIKEELENRRKEVEEEIREKRAQIQKLEQSLMQKEHQLERRLEVLERREEELYRREKDIRDAEKQLEKLQKEAEERLSSIYQKEKEIESLIQKEMLELQRIASMSMEEARAEILKRAEEEAKIEAIKIFKRIEEETRERAEFEAKKVITTAIQRLSPEIAINYTTTTVELPSNEFKGRIIGREGRNIRTFELLTGVDLIIDDTPDVVTISSFDPLRREIAKEALQILIEDGRIHPARIEEVVNQVKKEMDDKIRKMGEETCVELGLYDINPGLYYYIGKLYFRTSYSQNVLLHSKEVAYLAGLMAEELGLDAKMARRAGLLHDIGKSISHELGGSHTDIGIELCKKYGEPDPVLNAIRAHHNEEPVRYPEVALVCAADALSAARPGARRESLETYLKRLEKLESIVKSFKGVANAYAVQAGREVRIIVNPEEISDEEAYMLSKEIARKIEEEMEYPGQIKVVVIRETRHVEYAK